jgi:CubicO group peptidase (beta-lactamase class C family)
MTAMLLRLPLLLLTLPSVRGSATTEASPQRPSGWEAFTRALEAYATSDSIVGASALVLRDGRVLARHDLGWADRARARRADTSSIYHWASITKTLTAVAILQLRDRGKLKLDDRVTTYVPELRQVHNRFGSMDDVTIEMLLSHSAGFQDPTWPYRRGRPWEPFEPTRWEQLVAMMPFQELRFAPGSRYGYSNPAFIYLARIIEQLTGDSWQTYVQKNLLTPLGLTRSYFGATPYHLAEFRSSNYSVVRDSTGREAVVDNGPDFDPGITMPNSGWNAPLGDLAAWITFLSGAPGGNSELARRYDGVLPRRSLEEMWRGRHHAVEPVSPAEAAADSVGLSFFVLRRGGARFIGHTGSQAGFRSFFYLNPVTRAAVVVVFNTTNDARPEQGDKGFRALREAALALIRD